MQLFPLDDGNMVWWICSGSEYILSATYSHILPLILIYHGLVGQKLVTQLLKLRAVLLVFQKLLSPQLGWFHRHQLRSIIVRSNQIIVNYVSNKRICSGNPALPASASNSFASSGLHRHMVPLAAFSKPKKLMPPYHTVVRSNTA